MSDYMGTRILEVCECPESVADQSNDFGRFLDGENRAKNGLAPNWGGYVCVRHVCACMCVCESVYISAYICMYL